jgi:hypothetical protein
MLGRTISRRPCELSMDPGLRRDDVHLDAAENKKALCALSVELKKPRHPGESSAAPP